MFVGLFENFWDMVYLMIEEYGVEGCKGVCELLVWIGEFLVLLCCVLLIVYVWLGSYIGVDFECYWSEGVVVEGYG